MNGMTGHAKPGKRRDHLWVVAVISTACGIEVLGSWLGLGSVSGFPEILGAPTGWTLAVCIEAYAGYALWVWLSGAPGIASRRFAMWSALCSFALSLAGQVGYHQMLAAAVAAGPRAKPAPVPEWLVSFAAALPVIVLILGAVLVHLMHHDRHKAEALAEAAAAAARQAATERAENDELAALRAELGTAREELAAEREARTEAQREAALLAASEATRDEALAALEAEQDARQAAETARTEAEQRADTAEAKAERLSRKLGANSGGGRNRNAAPKDAAQNRTTVPNDVDARAQALAILLEEPGITGKELGERCGRGERWGQLRKSELAAHVADGGSQAQDGAA